MTETIQDKLAKIARLSGKSIVEVESVYKSNLSSMPASTGEAKRYQLAVKATHRELTGGSKSQAAAYEIVILGAEQTRDMMSFVRQKAIATYNADPMGSVARGEVKVDGDQIIVLDNRHEIVPGKANPNFGKPRPEHFYVKELVIAARQPGESTWVPGRFTLQGDRTTLALPIGKLVLTRANGSIVNGEYSLKSSTVTQFEIKQELSADEQMRIIDTAFTKYAKELGDGISYFKSVRNTPAFYNRLLVAEGTVNFMKFADDPTKNHMVVLGDESLGEDTCTVWVPNTLRNLLNFGRGSIVTVIGQPAVGKKYDREKKQQIEGSESLQINAYSIFGRPGMTTIVEESGRELI